MKVTHMDSLAGQDQRASETETDTSLARLMERPGFMFRRCSQAAGGYFERACKDLGLTTGQYDVLFLISLEPELDQDRLGQLLGLDRSTTGVLAMNLEKKRFIDREVKATDRRKRTLTMTPAGKKVFKAAEPAANAAREMILSPLSEGERDQLFMLLKKVVTAAG